MKIGILIFSKPAEDQHAQADRFEEAGREIGIDIVRIHEPLLTITKDGPGISGFDAIVCRPNFIEEPSLHQFTVQAFVNAGMRVINAGVLAPKNKLDQHVLLARVGVPMPRWAIAHTPENVAAAAREIGFPVILKVAFGTHGKGVFYVPNVETLLPIADYLAVRDGNPVIVEEFIETRSPPPARDLRVFVLGGEIIAAMERMAKEGDVRANASIGGTGHPATLTEKESRVAVAAANAFGLEIAGVDVLRSTRGPLIIEVNANPGFKELERVTGIDIAKAILEYSLRQ